MEEILIIKLSALGDIVQAEGAIHDIRLHHNDARITVLTTAPYKKIMKRCPWVDRVIIDPRVSWLKVFQVLRLRNTLRSCKFDMVYDLQQVDRTRLYRRLLLSGVNWMGDTRNSTFFLKRPKTACAADHFAGHLRVAGINPTHTLKSDIHWMADNVEGILKAHQVPEKFIVLLPGGSAEHPEKKWPGYGDLAENMIAAGMTPVTIPGPEEMDLRKTMPGIVLLNNNRYLNYFELAGVLAKASYIIGNDSGPTHIGAHLGRKGLALFGGHASALSSGIQHTNFDWIEVKDLQDLEISKIWDSLKEGMR